MSESPKTNPTPQRRPAGHFYPKGWEPGSWLVPYHDDNAVIHHGHTSQDDHSLCGPELFCCARSSQLFVQDHPESAEANAQWGITRREHVQAWMDSGVNVLYLIFCDPRDAEGLLAVGLEGDDARRLLSGDLELRALVGHATKIRG